MCLWESYIESCPLLRPQWAHKPLSLGSLCWFFLPLPRILIRPDIHHLFPFSKQVASQTCPTKNSPKEVFFKERPRAFLFPPKREWRVIYSRRFMACQDRCSLVYRPLSHFLLPTSPWSIFYGQLPFTDEETEGLRGAWPAQATQLCGCRAGFSVPILVALFPASALCYRQVGSRAALGVGGGRHPVLDICETWGERTPEVPHPQRLKLKGYDANA